MDRGLVEHLDEPAMNLCLYGFLCIFGIQYMYGKSSSFFVWLLGKKFVTSDFLAPSYATDFLFDL